MAAVLELLDFCSTSLEGEEDWRMLLMAADGKSLSTSGSLLAAHGGLGEVGPRGGVNARKMLEASTSYMQAV